MLPDYRSWLLTYSFNFLALLLRAKCSKKKEKKNPKHSASLYVYLCPYAWFSFFSVPSSCVNIYSWPLSRFWVCGDSIRSLSEAGSIAIYCRRGEKESDTANLLSCLISSVSFPTPPKLTWINLSVSRHFLPSLFIHFLLLRPFLIFHTCMCVCVNVAPFAPTRFRWWRWWIEAHIFKIVYISFHTWFSKWAVFSWGCCV